MFPDLPQGKSYTDLTVQERRERARVYITEVCKEIPSANLFVSFIRENQHGLAWFELLMAEYADFEVLVQNSYGSKQAASQLVNELTGRLFRIPGEES